MVDVTVKYFNILSACAGKKEENIALPEEKTVLELIMDLVDRNPPAFRNIVLSDGEMTSFIRVFVNDDMINGVDFDRVLMNGDRILLFPAVAGG